MKLLKKILTVIAVLIALVLIVALFVSGDIKYEKSIAINAPIEKVWNNVNSLAAMNKWSPWNDKDPNMIRNSEGTDGTVGAKYCWESEMEGVGKGCQTIKNIAAPNLIETDLKFLTPYESEAAAYVKLKPENGQTTATWGFSSTMPYPFRIMKLFMNIEKQIGADYELGLSRLKKLSEAN